MNSKQRRQYRRYLEQVWPFVSSWECFLDLPDYGKNFTKEFVAWRAAEGLTVEMLWESVTTGKVNIRFCKEEVFARYLMRWSGE